MDNQFLPTIELMDNETAIRYHTLKRYFSLFILFNIDVGKLAGEHRDDFFVLVGVIGTSKTYQNGIDAIIKTYR